MAQGSDLTRFRASLMCSTALLAVLTAPAAAQLASNARPTGGQVSAGQASIGGNASTTLITQSSENAAINWQSYNVGSKQTIQYVQPNAAAITLNRVVSANPSEIAGKITSNGQIIIVNQSGVVFDRGSQVDTAGLVVSASGITNKNFMAGHMVFDQAAHPGAVVSNAGNITVRQAGLAALVAPQVANSGVITARLGRVVLGGATTHTLDLYGDGLVALNVTGQVTQASLGGKQVAALVTNTGTILAPGGTVVLSASAVDGVVTNLVSTSGKIAAESVGAATGRVLVQGIGGGISIDGEVSAKGVKPGTTGGQVVANATGAVSVAPGAVVDVSGDAGGGVIALGTTASRAIGGAAVKPTFLSQSVSIAPGARIRADAVRHGKGGRIAVLSQQSTQQGGLISASGGQQGGDGGWIEVSGGKVSFGGTESATAPHGAAGSILIDPASLDIGTLTTDAPPGTTLITPGTFSGFSGNVILSADGTILINQNVAAGSGAVSLELLGAGGIIVNAALSAPGIPVALYSSGGSITEMLGQSSPGSIVASSLSAAASGPVNLTGANVIGGVSNFAINTQFPTTGTVVMESSPGVFTGRTPTASDTVPLTGLSTTGSLNGTPVDGSITLDNAGPLQVSSSVTAGNGSVTIALSGVATASAGGPLVPNELSVSANITGANVTLSTSGSVANATSGAIAQTGGTIEAYGTAGTAGSIFMTAAAGDIEIGRALLTTGPGSSGVPAGSVTLTASTGDIGESGGSIFTGTLSGDAGVPGNQSAPPNGDANFALSARNTISTLTGFTAAGTFSLTNTTQLTVGNLAAGGSITISDVEIFPGFHTDTAPPSPGILVLAGTMQAGGAISLTNSLGIAELASTPGTSVSVTSTSAGVSLSTQGAIWQGTGSAIGGALAATQGGPAALHLSAGGSTNFGAFGLSNIGTIHGIQFAGTLTAGTATHVAGPYSGSATLTASAGDILEAAGGSIRAGTLSASATVAGSPAQAPFGNEFFDVSAGNIVGTLLATSPSGGFALEDDEGLTVLGIVSHNAVSIHGPTGGAVPSGPLMIDGNISAPQNVTLDNAAGIAQLGGTSIISTLAGVTLTSASGGIGQLATASISGGVTSATGTAIAIGAGGTMVFQGLAASLGTVSGVSIGGTITAGVASGTLYTGTASLATSAGTISETNTGTLQIGTLVGGNGSGGDVTLEADRQLTLGNLDVGGNFTIHGPASPGAPSGILIIAGVVQAGGSVTLENALGIAELSGASVTGTTGVTLTTASGAIQQSASSTLAGLSSSGTALFLNAGGQTDFNTYLSSLSSTPVHGISFGGTLQAGAQTLGFYSGLANLTAGAGDILQTGGSLLAGTLVGSASGSGVQNNPPAGNAAFGVASGNTLSFLQNFSTTGSFVLEDDAGLRVGNLTAGTTIDIHGPTNGSGPTGFLTLAGNIAANGTISFSNSVGIVEISQASVTSTQSGVSLVSTQGAVLQQAGAGISGEENAAAGTGILVEGDGSTNFGALFAPTGPGTVQGIAFGGTLTAGLAANGIYSGQASLTSATQNIFELGAASGSPTGVIQAGTLGVSAPSGGIALATTSGPTLGNQVRNLAASSARTGFVFVDGQNLTVSGAVAVGAGATTPPTLALYTPALTVTGSLQLAPPNGVNAGPMSLVADSFSFSTAGDVSTAGGVVALDLLGAGSNTIFSVGAPGNTISPADLQKIQTGGGTLALGSLDGTSVSPGGTSPTSWAYGQGGTVSAIGLPALDLKNTNVAAALGLFSNGALTVSNGLTVTSLYGTAADGTATFLSGSNRIGTLGVLDSAGTLLGFTTAQTGTPTNALTFQLDDNAPLTISGPVLAEQGAVKISVTGTQAGIPNAITLGGPITSGTLTASGGNVTGTDVFLDAVGGVTQLTGTVQAVGAVAATPSDSTNGTVAIIANGGTLKFAGTIEGGTLANGVYGGAVLLEASAGDITQQPGAKLNVGTLAAQASGNVLLAAGTNLISTVGSLGVASENATITGLYASGSTGITLSDTTDLLISNTQGNTNATVSAIGPGGSGSATGAIQITVSTGSLTLGSSPTSNGATLTASGGVTLTAQGDVTQNSGAVTSTGGSIAITSQSGKIQSLFGALTAQSGDASLSAATSISQTSVNVQAGQTIALTAGNSGAGSITLANSDFRAGGDITITSQTGQVDQEGGSISATQNVSVTAATNIVQDVGGIGAGNNVTLTAGTGGTGAITQADSASIGAGNNIIATAPGDSSGLGVGQTNASMSAGGTVSLTSSSGRFDQATSTITGTKSVTLDFGGSVISSTGTIFSGSNGAGGTIVIFSGGSISSDGTIASLAVPFPGPSFSGLQPSVGRVLLYAAGGDILGASAQLITGTLAAAASGNITLTGGNYVGSIGSLSANQPNLTLYGLSAAGSTGITFVDDAALNILADTGPHPVIQALSSGATIGISEIGTSFPTVPPTQDPLSLGLAGTSTVRADSGISITSIGDIAQGLGSVVTNKGSLLVQSTEGNISQAGGTFAAPSGNLGVLASGSVSQSAGAVISAGGDITIAAGFGTTGDFPLAGNFSEQASSVRASGSITITAANPQEFPGTGNIVQSDGSTISAGGTAGLTATQGGFTQTASSILGSGGISLLFAGNITSTGSTLQSTGIAQGTSMRASVPINSAATTISVTSITRSITQSGGSITTDPGAGTVLLSASGDIATSQITTGTLAAAAGGNLTIGGTANQIANIAPQTAYSNGVLYALTGTITLTDAIALTVQPGAVIAAASGAPSGSITLLTAGLTLDAATLQAGADITLSAGTSTLIQSGGQIAAGGSVGLQGGAIMQGNGGFISAAGNVTATAATFASFTGSTLTATGNVAIAVASGGSGGNFTQGGDGSADLISAGKSLSVQSQTTNTQAGSFPGSIQQFAGGTLTAGGGATLASDTISLAGTVQAGADITLSAPSSFTQSGGQITAGGSISLQAANFAQQSGGLISAQGDVTLTNLVDATFVGSILHAGHNVSMSSQEDLFGTSFTQGDGKTADVISAGNAVAISFAGSPQRLGGQYAGTLLQRAGSTITAGQSVSLLANASLSLAGTVQAGTLAAGGYSGLLSLGGGFGGSIMAPTATLLAGTLTATATPNGFIDLSSSTNAVAQIGSLSAAGSIAVRDSQSLTVAGPVVSGGDTTFNVTGGFTENAAAPVTSSGALGITASGPVSLAGTLAAATTASLSGNGITELAGASLTGSLGTALTSTGAIIVDGQITSGGPLNFSSSTSLAVNQGASVTGGTGTLAAGGGIAIGGLMTIIGPLAISAGTSLAEGSTGSITASGMSLSAATGATTLGGSLTDYGSFASTSATDFTLSQGASLTADTTSIASAAGTATVSGTVLSAGSLAISAGADLIETAGANIRAASALLGAKGNLTIAGNLTSSGGLAMTAGTNVTEAASGSIAAGASTLTATTGATTLAGILGDPGSFASTSATDFNVAQGASIFAGSTTIAAGGAAAIAGSINALGNFSLSASSGVTDTVSGTITGQGTGAIASPGAIIVGGPLSFAGALTLTAGTNITQDAASQISSASSAIFAAPGTITLAGALAAPAISLGGPKTQDVVLDNTAIQTGANPGVHGATNAIPVTQPLKPGLGLFIDAASFQQTGIATVSPVTGNAATMQITIEGRGTASFGSLTAPATQLLLVLEQAGTANGQINVAGLNLFYTNGLTPIAPVNLRGSVGGHGGFAAAAVGFSHALSNANYQVNGCPIESINCVLLSPLVVPIVDPVNDYAESTQRRRRHDDDALPNVGEQDY